MQSSALMKLSLICLATGTLMSCATPTKPSPPSFSGTVRDVAKEQKVIDCNALAPDAIPAFSQRLIDTLPPKMAGESDWGYRDRLSDHDKGVYDWFQKEIAEGKRFQVYCDV